MDHTTMCYIRHQGRTLMLYRNAEEGDINAGKWIGVGGKFEEGESPDGCLLREVREETGLTLTDYRLRGIVSFLAEKWETEYMFLYTADGFCGELKSCDEGNLAWVKIADVPNLPLWEGDKVFFKLLEEDVPVFSLVLRYEGDRLVETVLNGAKM